MCSRRIQWYSVGESRWKLWEWKSFTFSGQHDRRKEKECQVSWSDNDDNGDVGGAVDGDVDGDDNVDVDVGGAVNGDGDGDGAVDGDIYVDADVDADADGNGDDDGDGGEEGVTRKRRAISLGLMRGQIFRLD